MYASKIVLLAILFNMVEYAWSETMTTAQFVFSCLCAVPAGLKYEEYSRSLGRIRAYLMFPFIVWMIEIVIHCLCLKFCGHNPAWHCGMFNGAIALNYYLPWVGVGFIFNHISRFVDHLHCAPRCIYVEHGYTMAYDCSDDETD